MKLNAFGLALFTTCFTGVAVRAEGPLHGKTEIKNEAPDLSSCFYKLNADDLDKIYKARAEIQSAILTGRSDGLTPAQIDQVVTQKVQKLNLQSKYGKQVVTLAMADRAQVLAKSIHDVAQAQAELSKAIAGVGDLNVFIQEAIRNPDVFFNNLQASMGDKNKNTKYFPAHQRVVNAADRYARVVNRLKANAREQFGANAQELHDLQTLIDRFRNEALQQMKSSKNGVLQQELAYEGALAAFLILKVPPQALVLPGSIAAGATLLSATAQSWNGDTNMQRVKFEDYLCHLAEETVTQGPLNIAMALTGGALSSVKTTGAIAKALNYVKAAPGVGGQALRGGVVTAATAGTAAGLKFTYDAVADGWDDLTQAEHLATESKNTKDYSSRNLQLLEALERRSMGLAKMINAVAPGAIALGSGASVNANLSRMAPRSAANTTAKGFHSVPEIAQDPYVRKIMEEVSAIRKTGVSYQEAAEKVITQSSDEGLKATVPEFMKTQELIEELGKTSSALAQGLNETTEAAFLANAAKVTQMMNENTPSLARQLGIATRKPVLKNPNDGLSGNLVNQIYQQQLTESSRGKFAKWAQDHQGFKR
ncbi:MAG: hypothetical protein JST16_00460 [Bdellovibrionales bacterium]|nr:hypothetical protein [Bdellovibrionales bacterium]